MNPSTCAPTVTKTWEYLFTVNRNNAVKLDVDDLEDVHQEAIARMTGRSYNDELTKKTIRSLYQRAVQRRMRLVRFADGEEPAGDEETNESVQLENERRQRLGELELTPLQRRIVDLLISGHTYPEIRKKLRLSSMKLRYHTNRIKAANAAR